MIVCKTPLRVSLFGGGSDFRGYYEESKYGFGSVISAALNMHTYIIVNKKFDDMLRIVYKGNELVNNVNEIKHNIIRECLKYLNITKGIEIIYIADLPMTNEGVGLASSSALTVGVLNALHTYKGEKISKEELAREACHIEIDVLGQRIGIQDQYAVANGGFNNYIFRNNGKVDINPIMIDDKTKEQLFRRLLLFYTGQTRDSSKILDEQNNKMVQNRENIDRLVEISLNVKKSLESGEIDIIGEELDNAWNIKKQLSKNISNPDIDYMYNIAKSAGAIGGKILGAGGGGFMLLYVKDDKKEKVRKALSNYKEIDFKVDYEGTQIILNEK